MFTLILTYVALIPPLILMWLIYKQDMVEREPVGLVLQMFLLGCLSPVIVFAVDIPFSILVSFFGYGLLYDIAYYFIKVALVEELSKMIMLRLRIWNHKEFNYRFDAIVYSVAVSIGFAAIENLMYVYNYGFSTGLLRAVTAIPAHTMFSIFMGYYMGEAKYYTVLKKSALANSNKMKALLVPVLLHGAYDFIATRPSSLFAIIFWVFVAVTDILALTKVISYARKDKAFTAPTPRPQPTNFTEIEKLLEEIRRQSQAEADKMSGSH